MIATAQPRRTPYLRPGMGLPGPSVAPVQDAAVPEEAAPTERPAKGQGARRLGGSIFTNVTPGRGLGYSPQTLSAIMGAGRDVATGPMTAARQRLADTFGQYGAPGLGSAEYLSALSGLENTRVAAGAENLAETLRSDEMLRRQDAARRASDLANYFGDLLGGRKAFASGKRRTSSTNRSSSQSAEVHGGA